MDREEAWRQALMDTGENQNDSWIKDDPNVNPSDLRFEAGNLILFKREDGWVEGEVLKAGQRLEVPPQLRGTDYIPTPISYLVYPHTDDADGTIWVGEDTDEWIRPRPKDLTPDPNHFRPHMATPEDPLAYLYTGVTSDPLDEDGKDMSQAYQQLDFVDRANTNPDGSISIHTGGRRIKMAMVEIPEYVHSVPNFVVMSIGKGVAARRRAGSRELDIVKLFQSTVPTEGTLQQLEEASTKSNEKMLQLGDALMSGVHGWPRDPIRACSCYIAAAWGCQECEESTRIGIPMGIPEAMVQYAYVCRSYCQVNVMGVSIDEIVADSSLLLHAASHEVGIRTLHQMFFFLSESVRRGWISPFALGMAVAVYDTNLINRVDDDMREFLLPLLQARAYRNKEYEFEKLQESGRVPKGDPSNSTIELFSKKCEAIFGDLTISSQTFHIEYREVPRVPFPTVVYVIVPKRRELFKVVRLPENLQASPFSLESFQFVWRRIAFALHLGVTRAGTNVAERTRPAEFTILNGHGNRHFASYLREKVDNTGTRLRLVSHEEKIKNTTGRGRRKRTNTTALGEIASSIETSMLEIPGFLVETSTSGDRNVVSAAQEEFVRQCANDTFEAVGNDQAQISRSVSELKTQGNDLFAAEDHNGATRCYSIAIQLLGLLVEHNNDTYKLLGTLLSNRAACFLEMESHRSSTTFRKLLAQRAITDCTVALKSSWTADALPQSIRDKLKFRLDKAMARYDALESEFESVVAPIIFPQSARSGEQDVPAFPRAVDGSTNQSPLSSAEARQPIIRAANWDTRVHSTVTQSAPHEERSRQDANTAVRNTESNVRQCADEADGSPSLRHQAFDTVMERGITIYENTLAKNACDGCPICLREFNGELSQTLSALLPCGEHALCVECICQIKKQSDKTGSKVLACPLCRTSVQPQFVEDLALQILDVDQELALLVIRFPADSEDSVRVSQELLWKQNFRVEAVIDILEGILDDRASGVFFRERNDLNHEQKNEIYREARRPVDFLQERLGRLLEERRTTFETSQLVSLGKEIRSVRSDLAKARLQARDDIYEQLNSVGGMGAEQQLPDSNVGITIDFHGLHVSDMHAKFTEHVQPILPVVKRVTIITGRGLHSVDGESKLKKELKKRIEREVNLRWEAVPNNPGAMQVTWHG